MIPFITMVFKDYMENIVDPADQDLQCFPKSFLKNIHSGSAG